MEQTGAKNTKLRIIFAVILAVLLIAYIAVMTMPLIQYTRLEPAEVAGNEENVSLMQYLWVPYNYADLTGDVLPDVYTDEVGTKYSITGTIAIPLFSFIVALISTAIVLFFRNKSWNVFFPFVWAFVSIIGYVASPFLNLSICNPTTRLIHLIIFSLVLVVSIIDFFVVSLPQMRYDAAHKEKI